MDAGQQKTRGAYYTPDAAVCSLVRWAVRRSSDRMLDPACGDGRFLAVHTNSVGVEQDEGAVREARRCCPGSLVHHADFFAWAGETGARYDCAVGNPPFIRYQRFNGAVRQKALALCAGHGVRFSSLSSSWAPFVVATAELLAPGGRMALVVPAEIGHAPYAKPVLEHLCRRFARVQIVAVRHKIFADLSEDCWLLYAEGCGGATDEILLSPMTRFGFMARPPSIGVRVTVREWRRWNFRLRPFLLSHEARDLYVAAAAEARTVRLGQVAKVGIGYVTGDNEFFHLRPSEADRSNIPARLLQPTVRSGKLLKGRAITPARVAAWRRRDEPCFLLRLRKQDELVPGVRNYLDSPAGRKARQTYKCRNRDPWYVVPDVTVPDGFLSYMSGGEPALVANRAACAGTNSVHLVSVTNAMTMAELQSAWYRPLTRLSCEIEGHPLGGGLLRMEPREAARVLLRRGGPGSAADSAAVADGIATMHEWRHCV